MSWFGLKERRAVAMAIIGASFLFIFTPTTQILNDILKAGSGIMIVQNALAALLFWVGIMIYQGNRI